MLLKTGDRPMLREGHAIYDSLAYYGANLLEVFNIEQKYKLKQSFVSRLTKKLGSEGENSLSHSRNGNPAVMGQLMSSLTLYSMISRSLIHDKNNNVPSLLTEGDKNKVINFCDFLIILLHVKDAYKETGKMDLSGQGGKFLMPVMLRDIDSYQKNTQKHIDEIEKRKDRIREGKIEKIKKGNGELMLSDMGRFIFEDLGSVMADAFNISDYNLGIMREIAQKGGLDDFLFGTKTNGLILDGQKDIKSLERAKPLLFTSGENEKEDGPNKYDEENIRM